MAFLRVFCFLVTLSFIYSASAQISPEWVRYPAISPDAKSIAFSYKGDIYRVAVSGGEATRLTFHAAHDFAPVWSADGNTLAFASERHGNFDVFVMDALGGAAKRLTFDSSNEIPYAFRTPKNAETEVVFKGQRIDSNTHRQFPNSLYSELYSVPARGGQVAQVSTLPLEKIDFAEDQASFVYQDVKGYENEWRKHHQSAVTRDIWHYNAKNQSHTQLTSFAGEDRDPVLSDNGRELYFLSERKGSFNVFKMPLNDATKVEQLTKFETHPVRFLSRAKNTLAFSYHGKLYTMRDGRQPKLVKLSIRTQDTTNRQVMDEVNGDIDEFSLSPNGKEIAFIANGDVFVSSKDGNFTKQITDTPESEASVSFSPDGKHLIYASERNLQWRIYTAEKARDAEPFFYAASLIKEKVLLDNGKDSYQPLFSPDGKKIAFIEDRRNLKVMNADATNIVELVNKQDMIYFRDADQHFAWSPDSQYLLFDHRRSLNNSDVAIVKADGSEPFKPLSQSGYREFGGKWTMQGKAILWSSNRHGLRSYATSGRTQVDVYAAFLSQQSWDEFSLTKADFELAQAIEQANKEANEDKQPADNIEDKDNTEESIPAVSIEWDDIDERVARLTIHSSFVADAVLDKEGKNLYYLTRIEDKLALWKTELRSKKTSKLISLKSNNGSLKWDKTYENLYFLGEGKLSTLDLQKEKANSIKIKAEAKKSSPNLFASAFDHIWLRTQKGFYDTSYHQSDWAGLYDAYKGKVAHIDNVHEFAELTSELLGELNVSHSGARARAGLGIDKPDATGRLGAFFDYDYTAKGIKVSEVIHGGPLDKHSVQVTEGDIITHIDGKHIDGSFDWAKLLNHKAGKFVLLSILTGQGETREFTVKPITSNEQQALLYKRFVELNEQQVLDASKGELGYVHIRSMSDGPYRVVFETMLGKHLDKKGIVVDTRFNGGGDLVADLAAFFTGTRFISYETSDAIVGGEPTSRYTKPIVGLFNEGMYSDGHCYASGFEDLDLGTSVGMPVPGTCSFSGWERLPIGIVWGMVPVSARNKSGEWMENNQTNPDILIKNSPSTIVNGIDEQLQKAVETLMQQVR